MREDHAMRSPFDFPQGDIKFHVKPNTAGPAARVFSRGRKKRIVVLTCRVRSSSAFFFTSDESNSWIVDREMFWDQSRTGFDFFV